MKTRVTRGNYVMLCSDDITIGALHPLCTIHVIAVSCPVSSDNSRSSSSMGYLEPRPPAQPSSNGEQVFSPKDIQKKLMDKVANLSTPTCPENEGVVQRAESGGGASTISTSRSSQSLNSSAGSSKGISFGSFFKRCVASCHLPGCCVASCHLSGCCVSGGNVVAVLLSSLSLSAYTCYRFLVHTS